MGSKLHVMVPTGAHHPGNLSISSSWPFIFSWLHSFSPLSIVKYKALLCTFPISTASHHSPPSQSRSLLCQIRVARERRALGASYYSVAPEWILHYTQKLYVNNKIFD